VGEMMPRPRNPKREKAKELYLKYKGNIPLIDIASQVNVLDTQVRKWKSLDKWEDLLKGNVTKQKGTMKGNVTKHHKKTSSYNVPENTPPKPTSVSLESTNLKTNTPHPQARPGNQNATGNRGGPGGPPCNKQAVSTGEFETITYAGLTDEEKALVNVPIDKYEELIDVLSIERVRRHRMMRRIHEAETAPGGMVVNNVSKTKGNTLVDGYVDITQTNVEASVVRVVNLETALSRVILGTQRGIKQLHDMEIDDAKQGSGTDDLADDWILSFDDE